MRVAVITMTRDRVEYTRHCFASLEKNSGVSYDHYIFDNASTDGTLDYLNTWACAPENVRSVIFSKTNIGISAGANKLLNHLDPARYDVIVKYDNDCELTTPNTLHDICSLVHAYGLLLSPTIHGLNQPPPTLGRPLSLGGTLVDEKPMIGGIFLAAPADLFADGYRHNENNPLAAGDDIDICARWRADGGRCGYVRGLNANHYETTEGQRARYPEYEQRKTRELAAR